MTGKSPTHRSRIVLLVMILGGLSLISNLPVYGMLPPSELNQIEQPAGPVDQVIGASPESIPLSEWPQVQRDPQHSGYYPENLGTNFQIVWRHAFQPEKVFPQVQAIISGGRVFVGTEMGNMYAFNATTGEQAWKASIGSPILNSVAVDSGKVFFGALDGAVYALNATNGAQVWKNQLSTLQGFSTAPVVADGKVMLGGRNGIFYALDPNSGQVLWSYPVGSPILQTAAWNNGKVYFGAMDMRVYAINSASGTLAWKSAQLPGMTFKDYWPLVLNGMVYIRPMGYGYVGISEIPPANQVLDPTIQQNILADYAANPQKYSPTLFRLYETNGEQAPMVIHYNFQTMNGATPPPCVDRDGYLIMPSWTPQGGYSSGWSRLNPTTRILVDALVEVGSNEGKGNQDETMNVTCSKNLILAMHIEEENANFTGYYNLDTRQWTLIPAGASNRQMQNNTQGGGGNPASIANGWVYHITYYELVARRTQP